MPCFMSMIGADRLQRQRWRARRRNKPHIPFEGVRKYFQIQSIDGNGKG